MAGKRGPSTAHPFVRSEGFEVFKAVKHPGLY